MFPRNLPSAKQVISTGNIIINNVNFIDTGFTLTLDTLEDVIILFTGSGGKAVGTGFWDIDIDGTRLSNLANGLMAHALTGAGTSFNISMALLVKGLTPGSHTFKLQARIDAGALTMFAAVATDAPTFSVIPQPMVS